MLQHLSLLELEKRLDTLLDAKMRALLESNKKKLASKHLSDFDRAKLQSRIRRIDNSLARILEAIRSRKDIEAATQSGTFERWR